VSDATIVLVVLASGTYALKSAAPLVLGRRELPGAVRTMIDLLPAALLASLAIVSVLADGRSLVVDARLVGLIAAGFALWRRAPFVVVIIVASMVTALTRLVVG